MKFIALTLVTLFLTACSNSPQGVRVVNGGTSAVSDQEGQAIRNLQAGEVSSAIAGRTFQYTRSDGNGIVTYNADGTMSIQDDTKGGATGFWTVSGEQYCETFGKGAAQECGVFKSTGDAYFAANSRLVEMKI
jgi:outer membrane biogenesis lipoprotein LolB